MDKELIDFKDNSSSSKTNVDVQSMREEINYICNLIGDTSNEEFQGQIETVYNNISGYVERYDRFFYSEITNIIFAKLEASKQSNIESNVDALLQYSFEKEDNDENIKRTNKAVFKIYDHINLACKQFSDLKENDQNYTRRFKERIAPEISKVQQEMTNQLLTLIGIFTALSFLLFGGISSLDNIFTGIIGGAEIAEVFILGTLWGIALINIMYIFLFLVGKMTDKDMVAQKSGSIKQKHPLIIYCNYLLITLLFIGGFFLCGR